MKWTEDEVKILKQHYRRFGAKYVSDKTGHTVCACEQKAFLLGIKFMVWSSSETEYLKNNWGIKTNYEIAKRLNRSVISVREKAKRLELGSWKESSELITLNQLSKYCGMNQGNVWQSWCLNNGLKYTKRQSCSDKNIILINIDDFWKWAESHKDFIHTERIEENILGAEPQWLKEKRKADIANPYKHYWTREDESRLLYDLSKFCYTYDDLCKKYGIAYKTLNKKINQLGTKYRPINPNAGRSKWNDEMEQRMLDMICAGMTRKEVATQIGKSDASIKSKIVSMYGTNSFDKIRRAHEANK